MKGDAAAVLREMLRSPRFEVLPTKGVVGQVAEHLPAGRTVTVTASMSMGTERTLAVVEELQEHGYRAVPHLAARMIAGRGELEDIVGRLLAAGVDSIFVPAGDVAVPAGEFASAVDLLRVLTELGSPFAQVGIAGYPESHPFVTDEETIRALKDKSDHATHVVSNLCFDPVRVAAWVTELRERGERLPLYLGVAGTVERARLLKVASAIGVGESTRFLVKNRSLFLRLLTPGGYSPERWLRRVLSALAAPDAGVEGLHIFTFNQIAATEEWRRKLCDRLR